MRHKVKLKKRFFGIFLIVILAAGAYFAFSYYKKNEIIQKKESHNGVSTLPIYNPPIVKAAKPLDGLENSYTITSSISAYFETEKGKRPSYGIYADNGKANLTFTLKEKSQGVKTTDKTIEYDVVIQNIPMKMRLTTMGNKVKEEFIIEKKPSDSVLSSLKDGLKINFDVKKKGVGEAVKNSDETYTFKIQEGDSMTIEKPTILDSKGKGGKISGEFSKDNYMMEVDNGYLRSAQYPVVIDPAVVVNTSSTALASYFSSQRHVSSTTEGTLHSFVQVGAQSATCGGQSRSGLLWFTSSDSGATWTCQGQISSDTSNLMYSDVRVDGSNNLYIVYSVSATGRNNAYDVNYRKFTYNGGSSWTMQSAQTVLDGSGTGTAYSFAVLELQGTDRIWIASRYYNGTNYGMTVYYSDSLGNSPTWSLSLADVATTDLSSRANTPVLVRYGSNKMGIAYVYYSSGYKLGWRFRSDSDSLGSWQAQLQLSTFSDFGTDPVISAVAAGDFVWVAVADGSIILKTFNGISWGSSTISTSSSYDVSLSTDGVNLWVFSKEVPSTISASVIGRGRFTYKKCYPPFVLATCDTSALVTSYQNVFSKVWAYSNADNSYTDVTTAASNSTTADVFNANSTKMVSVVSDAIYFGQDLQFDSISWALSTQGSGGTIVWEYCSSVDVSLNCTAWSTLTFSSSSAPSFTTASSSWGAFTAPADWVASKVNSEGTAYWYIRGRVSVGFSTAPIGTQMLASAQNNNISAAIVSYSNQIQVLWTENNSSPMRVRYSSITAPSQSSSSSVNIDPKVVGYSSGAGAAIASTQRHIVRTSDGTLHAFIQTGTQLACGGATGSNNTALMWIISTDGGTTWTCQGQVDSNTSTVYYADARADTSDNLYIVYSVAGVGRNNAYDVFYRKFTKGSGATWTMENVQTVLNGSGSGTAYHYAVLELQGTDRIWLAYRYYDGTNYGVGVYYSDGFGTAPTWTQSIQPLDTAGNGQDYHIPLLARFGSSIGVLWYDQTASGDIYWRYRADSDSLSSWNSQAVVMTETSISSPVTWSVVGTPEGRIFFSAGFTNTYFKAYYNGSWTSTATLLSGFNNYTSISTDGKSAFIFGQATTFNSIGGGTVVWQYRRCDPPYLLANCQPAVNLVPYWKKFNSVWQYTNSTSTFNSYTTQAGDTTSADVKMVSAVDDAMYFGNDSKFDIISWELSTNGTNGSIAWEYWNGTAWVPINAFLVIPNSNFTGDSYASFIPNTDWVTTRVNNEDTPLYYIRARVTTAFGTVPIGTQIAIVTGINGPINATINVFNNKIGVIWSENSSRVRFAEFTDGQPLPVKPAAQFNRGVRIQRGTTIEGGNP